MLNINSKYCCGSIRCRRAASPVRGRFPYRWELNVYRGCSHGCRYCYALYTHDYLEHSAAFRFYDTVYKKENIAEALERQLILNPESYKKYKIPVWKEIRQLQKKYNISADYRSGIRFIGQHLCNYTITEEKENPEQLDFFNTFV